MRSGGVCVGGGGLAPKLLIRKSHLGPTEVIDEPSSLSLSSLLMELGPILFLRAGIGSGHPFEVEGHRTRPPDPSADPLVASTP